MPNTIRRTAMTVGALGALALGGSALANAATSSTTATNGTSAAAAQRPDPTQPGGHVGANGKTEQAVSADLAAKLKAAALKKVPGATVERVETNVDGGGPYEAHITKADGSQAVVLFDASYNATSVQAMGHP